MNDIQNIIVKTVEEHGHVEAATIFGGALDMLWSYCNHRGQPEYAEIIVESIKQSQRVAQMTMESN